MEILEFKKRIVKSEKRIVKSVDAMKKDFSAIMLPLGTRAGVIPVKHAEATAFLLKIIEEDSEYQILFDAGSKRILNKEFINPAKIIAVFLSHAHLDHTMYLGRFLRFLRRSGRKKPLYIYCHNNGWKSLKWWIRLFCCRIPEFVYHIPIDLEIYNPYLKTHKKDCKTDLTQISKLKALKIGKHLIMNIRAAPALHCVSSVAYRINIRGDREHLDFVFSPDTSYNSMHLIPFAKNAMYWLLDSAFAKEIIDERYDRFLEHKRGGEIVCHSGPYYSGKLCQQANVGTYIMIHYIWNRYTEKFEDTENALTTRAKRTFDGNIIVSFDLVLITLKLNIK
ncbi:MAG: MBL fold metallo-hydrolase [Candidatus Lokiarchaeota archaeon]|nr:MBL fold metallo-hydrolase [Candidatus Lokiarchaeota archaeon]